MNETPTPLRSPRDGDAPRSVGAPDVAAQGPIAVALAFAALLLPWINPFAYGPSASVQPWLVSAGCACLLLVFTPAWGLRKDVAWALVLLSAAVVLRTGPTPDSVAFAAAMAIVGVVAGTMNRMSAAFAGQAWLTAALVSTGVAMCQHFGVADALHGLASNSSLFEAYANLRQRNQFATLAAIGMAVLCLRTVPPTRVSVAAALALGVGSAATTSRTGLLEILLLGALVGLWAGPARRVRQQMLAAVLVAYLVAAFVLPWAQHRVLGIDGGTLWNRVNGVSACSSRMALWANVLHLIAQKPWFGWGWGELDYGHFATLYEGIRFCDILDNAHNLPLHLAVELGAPLAALVLCAVAHGVARARPRLEQEPDRQLAWAVLALLSLHSLLEYPLWYGPFQIAAGLCIGILCRTEPGRASPRADAVRWAGAAFLSALVIYAAWDYWRISQIYMAPEERAAAYRDDTLVKVRRSWLFGQQAAFADLTLASLRQDNAQWNLQQSLALLHYSPEPKIIERTIESATMLHRDELAAWHLLRYKAAFPQQYERWHARPAADGAGKSE